MGLQNKLYFFPLNPTWCTHEVSENILSYFSDPRSGCLGLIHSLILCKLQLLNGASQEVWQ